MGKTSGANMRGMDLLRASLICIVLMANAMSIQAATGKNCLTITHGNKPCIFPFRYRGRVYNGCKYSKFGQGKRFWCPTEVRQGMDYMGKWGYCDRETCPQHVPTKPTMPTMEVCGTADTRKPCVFPFKYRGVVYNECTTARASMYWCSTQVNKQGEYIRRKWGYCDEASCNITQKVVNLDLNHGMGCLGRHLGRCSLLPDDRKFERLDQEDDQLDQEDDQSSEMRHEKVCLKKKNYGSEPDHPCIFPFKYRGVTYNNCTKARHSKHWCSYKVNKQGEHVTGFWGLCDPKTCDASNGNGNVPKEPSFWDWGRRLPSEEDSEMDQTINQIPGERRIGQPDDLDQEDDLDQRDDLDQEDDLDQGDDLDQEDDLDQGGDLDQGDDLDQ